MKYKQVMAGEWVQPVRRNYGMQCCKCGLIHSIDFRIKNGRIQFRAFLVSKLNRKRKEAKD